jgi:hypothetical protein
MMAALVSSETSVLTRPTRRNIPKDSILHNHRREVLKSFEESVLFASCSGRVGLFDTEISVDVNCA